MAIVRLDKVKASANGNLESVVNNASTMTNGLFFGLGGLVTGETELREVAMVNESAIATSAIEDEIMVFHATPEVMYDARKSGLKDFILEAGKAGRAYHLEVGDIVTLTDDLFTATPTVGQFATVDVAGTGKLDPSSDGTALASNGTTVIQPRLVLEVIESTTLGFDGQTAYAVQVIRN